MEFALALTKTGKIDAFDPQSFNSDACENVIDDRIKGADFMKINLFDRNAVSLCLSFSYSLKKGDGVLLDEVREFTFFDQVANG